MGRGAGAAQTGCRDDTEGDDAGAPSLGEYFLQARRRKQLRDAHRAGPGAAETHRPARRGADGLTLTHNALFGEPGEAWGALSARLAPMHAAVVERRAKAAEKLAKKGSKKKASKKKKGSKKGSKTGSKKKKGSKKGSKKKKK